MRAITPLAVVLWLSGLAASTADDQVTLVHKIRENSTFLSEITMRLSQKLVIAGTEIDTSSDTRSTSRSEIGTRDPDGLIRVKETNLSLLVNIGVMGQNYTFDSANPDAKGGSPLEILRDVHKAVARRVTTVVYDRDNRAIAVESDQDTLAGLPLDIQPLVRSQLDPEVIKAEVNDHIQSVKSDPLKPGDTWQRVRTANFGAGQVMDSTLEYTYRGTVDKDGKSLDKITSRTLAVKFALDKSPLPLSLKSSDLKASESEGVILFDRQLGGIVESSSKSRIVGDMVFSVNNQDLPAKLDLSIEAASTVRPGP